MGKMVSADYVIPAWIKKLKHGKKRSAYKLDSGKWGNMKDDTKISTPFRGGEREIGYTYYESGVDYVLQTLFDE